MTTKSTIDPVFGSAYGGTAPENYQRYFVPLIGRPFAEDLIAEAALDPGERVLDVACGTGVVARLAAERVGSSGTVAALDLNPAMLSVARSIPSSGAEIRWYETTAESILLPDDGFDVVLCQLGLQFVPDKVAAIREMRRVLAPGGRVLVSTPLPSAFFDVLDQALARHAGSQAAGFVRMLFSLHDAATIGLLFREAGFDDVSVRSSGRRLRLPVARDFLWQYVHSTPLAGMLSDCHVARIATLEREIVRAWEPWAGGGGMSYEQGMNVVKAHK